MPTVGRVDEPRRGAVLHVAPEDVSGEQIPGVEGRAGPLAIPSAEVAPGNTITSDFTLAAAGVAITTNDNTANMVSLAHRASEPVADLAPSQPPHGSPMATSSRQPARFVHTLTNFTAFARGVRCPSCSDEEVAVDVRSALGAGSARTPRGTTL